MKKAVEFEIIDVQSSNMYVKETYPCDGLYLATDENKNSAFIQVIGGMVYGSMMSPMFYPQTIDLNVETELKAETTENINGNTLLKALAIAQDASLAKDLIKE